MKNRVLALAAAALAFGPGEAIVGRREPPKFVLDIREPVPIGSNRDSPPQRSKHRVAMDKRAAKKKRRKS